MRNPSPINSSESKVAWGSRTETEIFDLSAFSFDLISTRSSIDTDKEERLVQLFTDWALQLREVWDLREKGESKAGKAKSRMAYGESVRGLQCDGRARLDRSCS